MKNHTSALTLAMLVLAVAAFGVRAAEHEHGGHGDAAKGHVAQSPEDKGIVAKQGAAYPLKTCLVSNEKLGGSMGPAVDYIYKDRLVRFCCKGCIKKFEAKADEYLAQLDKAAKEKPDAGAVKSQAAPVDAHVGHTGYSGFASCSLCHGQMVDPHAGHAGHSGGMGGCCD